MIVESLLVAICLLDASFCGFRDAAGRNKLIRKWGYYRRAIAIGTLLGVVVVFAIAGTVGLGLNGAGDPDAMYARYLAAGEIMLWIYVPFTLTVLVALLVYMSPKPHIKSLATVTVLGPLTLLRPFVIIAGALAGMATEPATPIIVSELVIIALVPAFGRLLAVFGVNDLPLERLVALETHTRSNGS